MSLVFRYTWPIHSKPVTIYRSGTTPVESPQMNPRLDDYLAKGRARARRAASLDYFAEIWSVLGEGRRDLLWLLPLFLVASLLELAGLGLIGPYIALVAYPDALTEGSMGGWGGWLTRIGVPSEPQERLVTLSLGLAGVFIVRAGMSVLISRRILLFCMTQEVRLRSFLMQAYQSLPYTEYLNRNSSQYIFSLEVLTRNFATGVIRSLLRLTSEGLVSATVLLMLAWANPKMLATLIGLLTVAILAYDRLFRRNVAKYGRQVVERSVRMMQSLNEGMAGFKEIRVLGKERYFHRSVHENALAGGQVDVKSQLIALAPRYMLEAVLIIFLVTMVIGTLSLGHGTENLLPTLGIFGVAALRLVPCANVFLGGLTLLRSTRHSTSLLYEDLQYLRTHQGEEATQAPKSHQYETAFQQLQLKHVHFRYPNAARRTLVDISLVLHAGESIGFVGRSGSGKTTMIDVILGLLEPESGELEYNGHPVHQSLLDWRSNVAYLPQEVFLIDNTLRRNVALGLADDEVCEGTLHDALDQARLLELVDELPQGVDTPIGERGVRLSGGQRQRIALARAFYHNRDVLVMDEATSALDTETEREIMESILRLKGRKTMIVIAHRRTTVQYCDRIYQIHDGRLVQEEGC
jgi:ATP-binding cassette, subfamily B, bacterial PglK